MISLLKYTNRPMIDAIGSQELENCHCLFVHNTKLHLLFKMWRLNSHIIKWNGLGQAFIRLHILVFVSFNGLLSINRWGLIIDWYALFTIPHSPQLQIHSFDLQLHKVRQFHTHFKSWSLFNFHIHSIGPIRIIPFQINCTPALQLFYVLNHNRICWRNSLNMSSLTLYMFPNLDRVE